MFAYQKVRKTVRDLLCTFGGGEWTLGGAIDRPGVQANDRSRHAFPGELEPWPKDREALVEKATRNP